MAQLINNVVHASPAEIYEGNNGICLNCGEEAYGVEPDARNYTCDCCEQSQVFGLEELIIEGKIVLTNDDE